MGRLTIPPEVFNEGYNIDISEYVVRHTFREKAQKNSNPILYLSYPHALRLFKSRHPDLFVVVDRNPETNGFVFQEVEGRGYFLVGHCEDQEGNRGDDYYFAVLGSSGGTVYPEDTNKDGKLIAAAQAFNQAYYRCITKVIALTTGIGLKLWTGEDLTEQIVTEKEQLVLRYNSLVAKWFTLTGEKLPQVYYYDLESDIKTRGKALRDMIDNYKSPETEKTQPADEIDAVEARHSS